MMFHNVSEFLSMGGHGPFVWSAYALSFVVIVFNFVWPVVLKRRNESQLRRQLSAAATTQGER